MSDTQAMAARLTAIAERLTNDEQDHGCCCHAVHSDPEPDQQPTEHCCDVRRQLAVADLRFLLAHVETLERRLADALAGNEVLRQDIEDAKEAAQAEQTRALLLGPVITQLQRERDGATAQGKVYKERALSAEQENARLTAECKRLDNAVAEVWDNVHRVVQQAWVKPHDYDDSPLDLIAAVIDERDEAEQQRDAAHAALRQIKEPK